MRSPELVQVLELREVLVIKRLGAICWVALLTILVHFTRPRRQKIDVAHPISFVGELGAFSNAALARALPMLFLTEGMLGTPVRANVISAFGLAATEGRPC